MFLIGFQRVMPTKYGVVSRFRANGPPPVHDGGLVLGWIDPSYLA
jgi:hypothetical protein